MAAEGWVLNHEGPRFTTKADQYDVYFVSFQDAEKLANPIAGQGLMKTSTSRARQAMRTVGGPIPTTRNERATQQLYTTIGTIIAIVCVAIALKLAWPKLRSWFDKVMAKRPKQKKATKPDPKRNAQKWAGRTGPKTVDTIEQLRQRVRA